jgi:hypothetical protein
MEVLGLPAARLVLHRQPRVMSIPPARLRDATARLAQLIAPMMAPERVHLVIAAQPMLLEAELGPTSLIPIKIARLAEAAAARPAWGAQLANWNESELARALTCSQAVFDRLRYLSRPSALPEAEVKRAARPSVLHILKYTRSSMETLFPGFKAWQRRRVGAAAAVPEAAAAAQAAEGAPAPAAPQRWRMGDRPAAVVADWLGSQYAARN